ncbi:helix-turn-helix domain-containing protein [Paraglaciecola arctica]|uniref:helix-turn-helix domain-containing protein n=1 Tax=Paraglaciecola arctica TaxID=1128911 RepID=UPI001C0709E3|nr:TetR/AcrR family transcriptional regulator [Paraglaciecola arctica]MBU3001756.1 TetR/AcrR family transcriptional regulator [Paraglaciecola arctica]
MLNSTRKIFDTAKECFFQHGYSAASIAMISRYSKVSRVTIHKQFSSKEILFRAFIQNFLLEKDIQVQAYINSQGRFWEDTYDFLSQRCTEVFENIPNAIIKSDLFLAGQSHCADLLEQNRIKTQEAIQTKLNQAIEDNQLSLSVIGLSTYEFAKNVESVAEGIMLSSSVDDPNETMRTTLRIYQIASEVNDA